MFSFLFYDNIHKYNKTGQPVIVKMVVSQNQTDQNVKLAVGSSVQVPPESLQGKVHDYRKRSRFRSRSCPHRAASVYVGLIWSSSLCLLNASSPGRLLLSWRLQVFQSRLTLPEPRLHLRDLLLLLQRLEVRQWLLL